MKITIKCECDREYVLDVMATEPECEPVPSCLGCVYFEKDSSMCRWCDDKNSRWRAKPTTGEEAERSCQDCAYDKLSLRCFACYRKDLWTKTK
jgi:hypothetical protein